MPSQRDTYVLVPSASRSAVLVHGDTLPSVPAPRWLAGALELLGPS